MEIPDGKSNFFLSSQPAARSASIKERKKKNNNKKHTINLVQWIISGFPKVKVCALQIFKFSLETPLCTLYSEILEPVSSALLLLNHCRRDIKRIEGRVKEQNWLRGKGMTNLLIECPIVNHSLLTNPPCSFFGSTLHKWDLQYCNTVPAEPILAALFWIVDMNKNWLTSTTITKPYRHLVHLHPVFDSNSSQR